MDRKTITGIFIVLICGMVFISGCTGPAPAAPVTASPPAAQTVSDTQPAGTVPAAPVLTRAPPLPTPAATTAVPANRTSSPDAAGPTAGGNGTGAPAPGYDKPPSTLAVAGVSGTLLIHVASGSGDGLTIYIARNGSHVPPFDPSFDPYRSTVAVQNPDYLHVKVLPDGNSGMVNLMPGDYLAYLPDRSGSEPEQQMFTVRPGYLTYVVFSGQAAGSAGGGCGC